MIQPGKTYISLKLLTGQDDLPARYFTLTPPREVSIGRSSKSSEKHLIPRFDNGYVNNPVISRDHATVKIAIDLATNKHVVQVQDNGSMHGTFRNGTKLLSHMGHTVQDDDVVRFGADVTRGKDIFKAPEFRFRIKQDPLPDGARLPEAKAAVPLVAQASHLTAKDGYCVPESDSESVIALSPVQSVIYIEENNGTNVDDALSLSSESEFECDLQLTTTATSHSQGSFEAAAARSVFITEPEADDDLLDRTDDMADDDSIEIGVIDEIEWDEEGDKTIRDRGPVDAIDTDSEYDVESIVSDDESEAVGASSQTVLTPSRKSELSIDSQCLAPEVLGNIKEDVRACNFVHNEAGGKDADATHFTGYEHLLLRHPADTEGSPVASNDPRRTSTSLSPLFAFRDPADCFIDSSTPHPDAQSICTHPATNSRNSKKRTLDSFAQDLIGEDQPEDPLHVLALGVSGLNEDTRFAAAPKVEINDLLPDMTKSSTKATTEAASPALGEDLSLQAQDQGPVIEANGRPSKRARIQSVAKTAGTVLASAVAGGVATFYALGLTPESIFA